MQNPNDVTTQAFDGFVGEVALEIGVTDKRIYEILGKDNPYPKIWRLLNPLGRLAPDRLELIRADFNARCDRLTIGCTKPSTAATVYKEFSEAFQKIINRCPPNERREAIVEAMTELGKQLQLCGGSDV